MKRQDKMPLVEALKQYNEKQLAYFCIPGHRYERGVSEVWLPEADRAFLKYDLTEADGLDDLHQPQGAIREAQELLAQLYQARESYFLVNGTTAGNQAMLLSTVGPGEQVIVPRNAHKSIMQGLVISGAEPVYIMPEWIEEWGMYGAIAPENVEKCFAQHPKSKAVMLVHPTYYGLTSNVTAIAEIAHRYGALLLVDEAHGGHLYFSDQLPPGALRQGADLCAQSFHKVTGALTQSSVLHVGSNWVHTPRLRENLQLVQTSSPSYLLMASLDAARYELAMHGEAMMNQAIAFAHAVREQVKAIPGITCIDEQIVGQTAVVGLDATRLTISADALGITGFELKERLAKECGVDVELADHHNILAIVTFANQQEDILRLVRGLQKIAQSHQPRRQVDLNLSKLPVPPLPQMALLPRQAYFAKRKKVSWQHARGRIAAEAVIPYPPGIPVLYPGEVIDEEIWDYIEAFRQQGAHLQGVADPKLEWIEIIAE